MIVTRRRRKRIPWRRFLFPLVAIALVVFAFVWPPSQRVILAGPLAPVWHGAANTYAVAARPFNFAAQNQVITDRAHEITVLQKQVADQQSQLADKDRKISQMQTQIDQGAQQAAAGRSGSARPAAAPSGAPNAAAVPNASGPSAAPAGDLSANASADMRRTAQYWSSMDPENAAKVIARLPVNYVARIFSLMSADSVGAILDALPPALAAQITQEHPEFRR